ncbi:MAG: hypothetical protein ABWY27_09075 [Telluria sp.]
MIENLDLHDATLVSVQIIWADGTCIVKVEHSRLSDCILTFSGVSSVTVPRTHPWGPSRSINSARQQSLGHYEIEMQSGDVIEIFASEVELTSIV